MANLIEQMNVLKGLTDEHLQAELGAPSGGAPPFLVASEIERRQGMRQRYEQEAARHKPRTTVVEDMMSAMPATGAMPGIGAPPTEGMPKFATGGIVDYTDMRQRYNDRLESLTGDKDKARAFALLAAGAGIMGGKSSNAFTNIGTGAQVGINNYQDAITAIDAEELALLRGITDIGQLQHADELAQLDRDFRERELASVEAREAARLADEQLPAAARLTDWYMRQPPEVQEVHDKLNPAFNPNAAGEGERLNDDLNRIFDNALKAVPDAPFIAPGEEQKAAEEKLNQARRLAYTQIKATYGAEIAANWARNQGLNPDSLLIGGTPAPGVDEKDPLGLGL